MTDERIDALIRRLDVADPPPPGFVDDTYLAVRGVAGDARRSDRSPVGWLSNRLPRLPVSARGPLAGMPAIVVVIGLLLLALWATLVGGAGRLGPPAGWPAGHIVFGHAHADPGVPGYDLFVVRLDGSGQHRLLAGTFDVARVSRDGRRIVVPTEGAVGVATELSFPTIVDSDATNPIELHPDPTLNLGLAAWSRAGDWLAFEAWDAAHPDRTGVWLMRPDGRDLHRLTGAGVPGDFSPNDRQLAITRQEGLFVVNVDGTEEHQVGASRPTGYSTAGFLPDGRSIYAAADGKLLIVNLLTAATTEIAVPDGNIVQPRLSPDGSQFVFTFDAAHAPTTLIWVMNVDGSNPHVVGGDPLLNSDFSDWLP
jgi:hypothetical protein